MREAAAAQAVALQDAKMEALVLSKKLRRLEAGGSHASLFEVYEEESRRRRRGGPTPRGASSPTTAIRFETTSIHSSTTPPTRLATIFSSPNAATHHSHPRRRIEVSPTRRRRRTRPRRRPRRTHTRARASPHRPRPSRSFARHTRADDSRMRAILISFQFFPSR